MGSIADISLNHERSARKSVTPWAMLLVGGVFIYAAYNVDPLDNCDASGSCAPWLIPIAGIIGWCLTAMALGQLLVNPNRGCRIDERSGELLWWKNRTSRSDGDTGRIHPSQIVSIYLDLHDDGDTVSLHGKDGERLPYFDEELLPWPYDRWAERLQRHYPHILINRRD